MRRRAAALLALAALGVVSFLATRLVVGGPEGATSSAPEQAVTQERAEATGTPTAEQVLTDERVEEHNRLLREEASKPQFTGQMGPFYPTTSDEAQETNDKGEAEWSRWCGGTVDWDSPQPSDGDFYYTFPDGSLPTALRCPQWTG